MQGQLAAGTRTQRLPLAVHFTARGLAAPNSSTGRAPIRPPPRQAGFVVCCLTPQATIGLVTLPVVSMDKLARAKWGCPSGGTCGDHWQLARAKQHPAAGTQTTAKGGALVACVVSEPVLLGFVAVRQHHTNSADNKC